MQPAHFEATVPEKKPKLPVLPETAKPKALKPEEIPPPPPVPKGEKSGAVLEKMDVPAEPPSWFFTASPEKKSNQLIEAQLPPRPSEPATRR